MDRLTLKIDVFEKKEQEAVALPSLTLTELIESILQEFRELEYLNELPDDYVLLKAEDDTPLEDDSVLGNQLQDDDHLVMVEKERPLPSGTVRPSRSIYLRDQAVGRVYPLQWLPAIVGRPDKNQSHDDWLAVNLERHKAGLRVSRRHLEITEKNGRYFVSGTPRNPARIRGVADGEDVSVMEEKRPLRSGDTIHLERSNITLKFIVRE